MKSRDKKLALLAIIIVGVCVAINLYGTQAYLYYKARNAYPKNEFPEVYLIPEELTLKSSIQPKTTFTNYGFQFAVPWNDLSKTNEEEPFSVYRFSDNRTVVIEAEDITDLLHETLRKEWHGKDREGYESFLGKENISSSFALLSSCLNISPDSFSLFEAKQSSLQKLIFLLLKSVSVSSNTNKIYAFSFDNCKGFQFGDPLSDSRVRLICFTDSNTSTSFLLSGGDENKLNQEEVNCIIKTLKKIESEPVN